MHKNIHIYVERYPASHFIGVTENAFRIASAPSLWNGTTYELKSKLLTEGYITGDYYYYGGVLRIGGIMERCSKSTPLGFVDTSRSIQSVYGGFPN